MNRDFIAQL